jgi:iron complex outermembrane receptor protein
MGRKSMKSALHRLLGVGWIALVTVCFWNGAALAQEKGSVTGVVRSNTGEAAPQAQVMLVELRLRTSTGTNGDFTLEGVPPGKYLLQVTSREYGSALVQVTVGPGAPSKVDVKLELAVHHEDVVVSSSPYARSSADVAQPVTALAGQELQAAAQQTLGETLAEQPGVSSTSYSPGASRPVVRGLGGDRIRILSDGIGVGDASNVSEDHAVSVSPLSAERIEIVRGAATLLYGSNAVGGVVNILDNRIPDHVPEHAIEGSVEAKYGSAADDRAEALSIDGGQAQLAWHADALNEKTGDVSTPIGTLVNSENEVKSGATGVSWASKKGFLGVSYARFDTTYGIPTDERVSIDMNQNRYDLGGELLIPSGFLQSVRVRLGHTSYDHAEIESDGAVGTKFLNDSWEGRIELPHRQAGPFKGAFGVQASTRDFQAIGVEGFVPPTTTDNQALFVFENIGKGKVTYEAGARYESQKNTAKPNELFLDPGPDRSFGGLSGSAAIVLHPAEDAALSLTLSRATRMPTPEELYANGPHAATFQFVIGDPALDKETSDGIDLSFRKRSGRVSGEIDLFANRYNGFIFLSPTGEVDEEGVPIFQYIQSDSRFRGGELHVDVELLHRDPHHLVLELGADMVRAELTGSGEPLPRIPPRRESIGIRYQGARLFGSIEARVVEKQDRVADFETPTDGYTWVNATVGYRLVSKRLIHDFILRGSNLTDELARNHVSPLKDEVPLAGRDVNASCRLTF